MCVNKLTTSNTSCLSTVAVFIGIISAVLNMSLISTARDLVIAKAVGVNIAKLRVVEHLSGATESKLPADHVGCVCVPAVVADYPVDSKAVCRPDVSLVGGTATNKAHLVVSSWCRVVATS